MILVTGATGFLGRHLVSQLLETGAAVRGLCRRPPNVEKPSLAAGEGGERSEPGGGNVKAPVAPTRRLSPAPSPESGEGKIEWSVGDVRDAASLKKAMQGVTRLYHVAGRIDFDARDLQQMQDVNIQGTRNVLNAAQEAEVQRVVHVSSVSTIGAVKSPDQTLNEDDFGKGLAVELPYPASKLEGERVALEFAERGLPVVIANPTYMGGPGDVNLGSVHTAASFVRGQVWVGLTTGGFGYTDIRDAARGLRLAMEKGVPGRRYIIGGQNILLREYHELLAKLTLRRPPRFRLPPSLAEPLAVIGRYYYRARGMQPYVTRGDVRMGRHYWLFDFTRARSELGFVPRPIEDSLRDCLLWLGENDIVPREKVAHLKSAT